MDIEAAAIVFVDIVRYSSQSEDEQAELIIALTDEVRSQLGPKWNPKGRKTICIPTGDGMAVVVTKPESTVLEWILTFKNWADRFRAEIRIGAHVGVVSLFKDINNRPNIVGVTINTCQRIMNAAQRNQVLVSSQIVKRYAGMKKLSFNKGKFKKSPAKFKGPFDIIAKHGQLLNVYIMHKKGDPQWETEPPIPHNPIIGRMNRTRYIAERLDGFMKSREDLLIYERAAFSTFCLGEESLGQANYDEDYARVLKRQRDGLHRLGKKHQLKLIINPRSRAHYPARIMVARYRMLLVWMRANKANSCFDWVEASYSGPNQLIIAPKLCIEGYKHDTTAGYDSSFVFFDEEKIFRERKVFEDNFRKFRKDSSKESVIASLEEQLRDWEDRL